MTGGCNWLPPLILLSEYGGDAKAYLDAVYAAFCEDLRHGRVRYRGRRVAVRHHPPTAGKGFGFWHCVQEGSLEGDRIPEMRRCERIRWIRAVIENTSDPAVQVWTNSRGSETCHLLWYREEYLVVLAERGEDDPYFLLKTAYCTERRHTIERLLRERDAL